MGHFPLHSLICLCWCYVYVDVGVSGAAEVTIPHRVSASGSFISYSLPAYWHRQATTDDLVHYLVRLNGEDHHLELRPNRALLAPHARVDTHGRDGIRVKKVPNVQCQFQGRVRGVRSRVAVSTCNGLTGHISTPRGHFMIEPREALTDARHPHLVYLRHRDAPTPTPGARRARCPNRGSTNTTRVKREEKHEIKVETEIKNMYSTDIKNDLYLELLLVLDKSFVDHHTQIDTEHYVMTVMNMAHDLFAQESLGRPVYLSIVRIIRLEVEDNEINVAVIQNPSKALESFQKWQALINPGNDSHPNHHDLAILLTRVDIYASDGNRDLLGVAHQAGACNHHQSGVIAQDIGLTLGFIIAHEIGHSLGFLHDDATVTGCKATLPDGMNTVMSSSISILTGDWSVCSKKYLRIFIESGYGYCLKDHPADHPFTFVDELPGVSYDGNWQCRSAFGGDAEMCDAAPRCDTLLCQVPNEGCIESHMLPADGTSCGEDKWCYHGHCLQRGMRPAARDGGWGPWGTWSECSRTCGTGVAYRERRCDSPTPASSGEFCKGPKRKYKICNTTPCPTSNSFRDTQCATFNSWVYPEDGKTHYWKAVITYIDDPCSLYCVNEIGNVTNLADRVVDGTSCLRGIRDICIAGNCVRIPCDLEVDSGAVEDACGICHGDGTTCAVKEGIKSFKESSEASKGSNVEKIFKLIDLPEDSQNIHIEETEPTRARIEVRDADGKQVYVSGENFGLFDLPGSRAWMGMLRVNQETLHIPGPIAEPLTIWVDPKSNVTLKYSLAVATEKRHGAFGWDFVDWTPCSIQCGVGTSLSRAKCVEQSSGMVDDTYCKGHRPKDLVKSCEDRPCLPRWYVGEWEKCIKKRGSWPSQSRYVRCVRPIGGELSDLIVVEDTKCPQPKPITYKACEVTRSDTKRLNTWSSKSRKQRRTDEDEEFLKEASEDVKQFSLQKGKIYLDKINSDGLKLHIQTEEVPHNGSRPHLTVKDLYGKEVEAEMDKLSKCRPKQDQI